MKVTDLQPKLFPFTKVLTLPVDPTTKDNEKRLAKRLGLSRNLVIGINNKNEGVEKSDDENAQNAIYNYTYEVSKK